jgi:hypothetical protein
MDDFDQLGVGLPTLMDLLGGGGQTPDGSASPYSLINGDGLKATPSGAAQLGQGSGGFMDESADWLKRLMDGDKKTGRQAQFGLGALGLIASLLQSRKPRGYMSPTDLQNSLPGRQFSNFTPAQQTRADAYFGAPARTYVPPPPRFAEGGALGYAMGGTPGYAMGGSPGYVQGGGGGQSDVIDARLSPGEYVMDSDVVSALGDGSNEAGAKMLDQMREHIRAHKRSAPASKIPPKAKQPLAYLNKKG